MSVPTRAVPTTHTKRTMLIALARRHSATRTMPLSTCLLSFRSSARNSLGLANSTVVIRVAILLSVLVFAVIGFHCSTGKIRRSLVRPFLLLALMPLSAECEAFPHFSEGPHLL